MKRPFLVSALCVALCLVAACSSSPAPSPAPTALASAGGSSDGPTTGQPTGAPDRTLRPGHSPRPGASEPPASEPPGGSQGSGSPSLEPGQTPTASGEPPASQSPGGVGAGPLPRCRYRDVPAVGDPDTDWPTIVLDTIYTLPADYVPRRLVSTAKAGMDRGYEVIPAVVGDLRALHEASLAAGDEVAIRWAYRSYAEQQSVQAYWASLVGPKAALHYSARPGHSEHGLGTAIDFRSGDSAKPPWNYSDWGTTGPGRWMRQNAWQYGFVLSYPKGMQDETCYAYEPWHYRYVGRDLAAAVHASGETLRRYLWEHQPAL